MDKKLIIDFLIESIQSELDKAQQALESTNSYKSGDMKQEGKYDTRAIEAGYLAGAQQKRVKELEIELALLKKIDQKALEKKSIVSIGSIVDVKGEKGMHRYFILPAGGGVSYNGVSVITTNSPMGNELIQLEERDSFELESPNGSKVFEVVSII